MLAERLLRLTPSQVQAVEAPRDGVCVITGPPGSGKTTALATRAVALAERGPVVVWCSHDSSVRAMRAALALLEAPSRVWTGTAPQYLLGLLQSHYALAGVHPDVRCGGEPASRAIVQQAAAGFLDLTWSEVNEPSFDLNLPGLSRPDAFLDEAATLIRQLRGARIGAEEFAQGCAAGISAFYGNEIEAALAKCRDPNVLKRSSRRGRAALGASPAVLQAQRRAERDLGIVLARLYREYLRAARTTALLSDEDIVDECVRWLLDDTASARSIASGISALLLDDAEDAHPGAAEAIATLVDAGVNSVTLCGWEDAAIDGLCGRRSALKSLTATSSVALTPLGAHSSSGLLSSPGLLRPGSGGGASTHRFATEEEEVAHVAASIADLLREGVPPRNIALLTRNADAAESYAEHFSAIGLPVDSPVERFAHAREIDDWLALTAVVDDPADHEHLLRVLASPVLGLSDSSIFALCEDPQTVTQLALGVGVGDERRRPSSEPPRRTLSRNVFEGVVDQRLSESARERIARFRDAISRWREELAGAPAWEAARRLAFVGGFMRHWEAADAHLRVRLRDDVERVIEAFTARAAVDPALPLNALVRAFEDGMMDVRLARRTPDAIACDTITSAKGCHWPHVFVVGLAYERFPRVYLSRKMAFSRTYGLIVRENVAPGAAQTAKFAWYYARFNAKALYLAEERRALKYGLSRGTMSASASGFGEPPTYAKDYDLLRSVSTSS